MDAFNDVTELLPMDDDLTVTMSGPQPTNIMQAGCPGHTQIFCKHVEYVPTTDDLDRVVTQGRGPSAIPGCPGHSSFFSCD